jgi:hypothetical protein
VAGGRGIVGEMCSSVGGRDRGYVGPENVNYIHIMTNKGEKRTNEAEEKGKLSRRDKEIDV